MNHGQPVSSARITMSGPLAAARKVCRELCGGDLEARIEEACIPCIGGEEAGFVVQLTTTRQRLDIQRQALDLAESLLEEASQCVALVESSAGTTQITRMDLDWSRYPEDLRRSVRVYLGLRFAGLDDYELIARAIGWTVRKSRRSPARGDVLRAVLLGVEVETSDNPTIRAAALIGLPASATAILENRVLYTCPGCRFRCDRVPCYRCAPVWPPRPLECWERDTRELPRPDAATEAAPGSLEKLWIMQSRAALGQSLFHPDDKTCDLRYDWQLPVIKSDELVDAFRDAGRGSPEL